MTNEIRSDIISFRQKLDTLNGVEFSWKYQPKPQFKDKESYPLDFQIFMEEIGELSAGSDPQDRSGGYLILNLEQPVNFLSAEDEGFYYILDTPSAEDIFVFSEDDVGSAADIMLIATDVDARNYGFKTTSKPFKFLDLCYENYELEPTKIYFDLSSTPTFFDWFKSHMISLIGEEHFKSM